MRSGGMSVSKIVLLYDYLRSARYQSQDALNTVWPTVALPTVQFPYLSIATIAYVSDMSQGVVGPYIISAMMKV